MTFVLARTSRNYVLQIADRLVTRADRPYDASANKTILYRTANGIVTIGYTGLAYVGDVPTDKWIVEQITGITAFPPMAMRSGPFDYVDTGRVLRRLREALGLLGGGKTKTRDEAEDAMVNCIRAVATNNPLVGPDCISVLLSPPRFGVARVRFIPARSSAWTAHGAEVGYTPWILGPNLVLAPSVIRGKGWKVRLAGYDVRIESPPEDGHPKVLLEAQKKPQP
jgi:hypothetical protein